MNLSETLLASSLEDFLSDEEAVFLLDVLDSHIASLSPDSLIPGRNGRSIHSIDGLEVHQTVAVYEPAGRVEVEVVPAAVDAVMGQAMARRWADVQRAFPSARQLDPWIYVEYGPGQYVTPHVDYAHNDDAPRRPKVAGISVLLNDGFAGGELFVETSGSSRLWHEVDGNPVAAEGADLSSDWFASTPRTRWTAAACRGTAYLYGSQLVHGTLPVRTGRVRKLLSWLTA